LRAPARLSATVINRQDHTYSQNFKKFRACGLARRFFRLNLQVIDLFGFIFSPAQLACIK
jgi:hypothetical protein